MILARKWFSGSDFTILSPKTHVILVESDLRKAEFLKHICATLNLKNTEILARRVETLPNESVDFAISRGFANLSKSLLVARKVLRPGGCFSYEGRWMGKGGRRDSYSTLFLLEDRTFGQLCSAYW